MVSSNPTLDFLSNAFGKIDRTPDANIQLYDLPPGGKGSFVPRLITRDINAAADFAAKKQGSREVYFSCCGIGPIGEGGRGKETDAQFVPWLYTDLDAAGDTHPGKSLPTKKQLSEMLRSELVLPMPSYVVDTGGGLHVYWLLSEPIVVDSQDKRAYAKDRLLAGIDHSMREWYSSHGFEYDNVCQLARVLRVPGTKNHKHGTKPVKIIWPKGDAQPVKYDGWEFPAAKTVGDSPKPTAKVTTDIDAAGDMAGAMKAANAVPPEWSADASRYVLKICRQCVRYGLDTDEAVRVVRAMEAAKGPFPKQWSDAEIRKRFKDASEQSTSGEALQRAKAAKADPRVVASQIIEDSRHADGASSILWHQGALHLWSGGKWQSQSKDETRATVANAMDLRYTHVLPASVSGAIEHIRALTQIPDDCGHPTWLTPHVWPANECFATADKIVHLPSHVAGAQNSEIDATPSFFTTSATDYAWSRKSSGCPEWLRFLQDVWPDDPQSIELLQMWFGYCLVADNSQQKMLLVLGPPRSGKGTIARTLTQLVGVGNVANPTLASMATEFGLQPMLGKSVGIISDMRIGHKTDVATATERLLSISGDDALTINRKYQPAIHTRLPTRMMLCSNVMPQLRDASGALASRFVILEMKKSFLGHEDHGLGQRLLKELPGILHWSIEGYAKLRNRGKFTETQAGLAAKSQLDELTSEIKAFIADRCDIGPDCDCRAKTLYAVYRRWCTDNAPSLRPSSRQFGRDLKAAVTGLKTSRESTGDRAWKYIGVGLLPSDELGLATDADLEFSSVQS